MYSNVNSNLLNCVVWKNEFYFKVVMLLILVIRCLDEEGLVMKYSLCRVYWINNRLGIFINFEWN